MTFRFVLSAGLFLAAAPAVAQTQPSPPPQTDSAPSPEAQAAIQQAAMAFGQCVAAGVQSVAATETPEAGAARVLNGCANQRAQLEQSVEAYIATMPEDRGTVAREQLRARLGEAESQIAGAIRQSRAAPAPAPGQ